MNTNVMSVDKISRLDGISFIHTKAAGMTVREMIRELKKYSPDEKIYMYTENGDMVHVCRVMKDKRRVVLF